MIIEIHRKDPNNIGDYYCNASRYFDFPECHTVDIGTKNLDLYNKIIIIGGGGLIHKGYEKYIQRLLKKQPKYAALWGAGHNFGPAVYRRKQDVFWPDWLNQFNMVGVRDYWPRRMNSYLPCVSCMHPAFDRYYQIQHPVVFYLHGAKSGPMSAYEDLEWMSNQHRDFDEVIAFLASGRVVVTNSYHGAYWAMLLGREVRTTNWSVKFDYFRHPPTFIPSILDWQNCVPGVKLSGYLNQCRSYNVKFYRDFMANIADYMN